MNGESLHQSAFQFATMRRPADPVLPFAWKPVCHMPLPRGDIELQIETDRVSVVRSQRVRRRWLLWKHHWNITLLGYVYCRVREGQTIELRQVPELTGNRLRLIVYADGTAIMECPAA